MVNMIEAIFYGDLNLPPKGPAENSEYRRRYDDIAMLIQNIERDMSKETGRALEDAVIALEEVVARDYFVIGFQWGAKMMLSILGKEPDTFGYQHQPPIVEP